MAEPPRSPGSTIAASEFDDHMTHASSPIRADPRTSLQHVLGHIDSPHNTPSAARHSDMTEDEGEVRTPGPGAEAPSTAASRRRKDTAATATTKDNPIYLGNKVRHLKKDDGEPLWRKDIQYDFLKYVFENDQAVFTNSYEPDTIGKQTFADLYIDTMARSSKTSKILRDKLLTEHEPARNMAMVCLLVNLGRMNTTLNFFPEMRAQLRTYHAIPSLQARQDPNSYKQLQDAPRLKSILKGASEDRPEPTTLEKIKIQTVPRTNPVNMVFVLAQFAPKITELHMPPERDFYDLLMKYDISSETRGRAFLWLLWFYLESDFTEEGAEENPFGAGVDYDVDVRNQGVPRLEFLTPEQEVQENIDTTDEIVFGRTKQHERKRIIEADQLAFQAENGPPKRGPKPKLNLLPEEDGQSPSSNLGQIKLKHESDMESTRSTPPRGAGSMRVQSALNTTGKGRNAPKGQLPDGSSPIAPPDIPTMRRPRPLTAHQLAVERNRNQRIDYILSRGIRKQHHATRKIRRQEGAIYRAFTRTERMTDPFAQSDDDEAFTENAPFRAKGFGGLIPLTTEEDDFGEELCAYAAAFRRMGRRLERWEGQKGIGVMGTNRVRAKSNGINGHGNGRDNDDTEDDTSRGPRPPKFSNGDVNMEDDEALDDMEKEILGIGSEAEDEDLDDVDKALLGIRGDETEEEENGNWE